VHIRKKAALQSWKLDQAEFAQRQEAPIRADLGDMNSHSGYAVSGCLLFVRAAQSASFFAAKKNVRN
jgi:hypothetical protein